MRIHTSKYLIIFFLLSSQNKDLQMPQITLNRQMCNAIQIESWFTDVIDSWLNRARHPGFNHWKNGAFIPLHHITEVRRRIVRKDLATVIDTLALPQKETMFNGIIHNFLNMDGSFEHQQVPVDVITDIFHGNRKGTVIFTNGEFLQFEKLFLLQVGRLGTDEVNGEMKHFTARCFAKMFNNFLLSLIHLCQLWSYVQT